MILEDDNFQLSQRFIVFNHTFFIIKIKIISVNMAYFVTVLFIKKRKYCNYYAVSVKYVPKSLPFKNLEIMPSTTLTKSLLCEGVADKGTVLITSLRSLAN